MAVDAQTERDRMQEWNTAIAVPLSGNQQMPESVDTDGTGMAVFWPNEDMSELCYIVIVDDLDDDVTQASIHWIQQDDGTTGEPVMMLLPSDQSDDDDDDDGVIAVGTIDAQNLTGPMAGASMTQFIDELEAGNLYVNVMTEDYPNGEIRGDIDVNMTCQDIRALGMEMIDLDDDDRARSSGGGTPQANDDDNDDDDDDDDDD
jgi:hypothetical protein